MVSRILPETPCILELADKNFKKAIMEIFIALVKICTKWMTNGEIQLRNFLKYETVANGHSRNKIFLYR